jgi:hypothetical protein
VKLRAKIYWLSAGCLLLVACGILLGAKRSSTPPAKDWLVVSGVTINCQTNASIVQATISISLSNGGQKELAFKPAWMECRSQPEFRYEQLSAVPAACLKKATILAPGAKTNINITVDGSSSFHQAYLFCAQIEWIETESKLLAATKVIDAPLYWIASMLEFNWDPPWRHKKLKGGDVFAGNIGTEDFFRKTYGFTREQWVMEQQSLNDLYSRVEPGGRVVFRRDYDANQMFSDARLAFSIFCRKTTEVSLKAEPGAASTNCP